MCVRVFVCVHAHWTFHNNNLHILVPLFFMLEQLYADICTVVECTKINYGNSQGTPFNQAG